MRVAEVMKGSIASCTPETGLAAVAALMCRHDCGVLPVMVGKRLEGILTDRDICIALGARDVYAHTLTAADVAHREVFTCSPDDDIHQALEIMRHHKVRRLPVFNRSDELVGMLSLNQVIVRAHKIALKPEDIAYEDVINTLRVICGRLAEADRPVAAREKAYSLEGERGSGNEEEEPRPLPVPLRSPGRMLSISSKRRLENWVAEDLDPLRGGKEGREIPLGGKSAS